MLAATWSLATTGGRLRAPVLVLSIAAFVVFAISVPGFASPRNVAGILFSALPLLLLATGQTFVLVSGGIDLSATAVVGLASVAGGLVMSADAGVMAGHQAAPAVGPLAMLATGAVAGLVNGACVGGLRMPAFMVTLTTSMFAAGLAVLLVRLAANTETMFNLPRAFVSIGSNPFAAAAVACGCALAAQALLGATTTRALRGCRAFRFQRSSRAPTSSAARLRRWRPSS
jgi:ribose transport system permease protein